MKLLITGGRVINPATGIDEVMDLMTEDGEVLALEKSLEDKRKEADEIIEAKGCFVMPGFVDLHVHFRDPGQTRKEDVFTGMRAAAHGGYTSVFPMPNTKPVADSRDVIDYVTEKARNGKDGIHVYQVGAVTKGQKGEELAAISEMVEAGCKAISEDGKSVMNADLYRKGMREAARLNIPVFAHCEDINLVHGGVMNADEKSTELGLPGITNSAEDVIIARDILLAKETGAQLHLCHCSTKDSVWMVEQAQKAGLPVSGEVCPHHFTLTSEDITEFKPRLVDGIRIPTDADADTNYKMNPPLRRAEDVRALRQGLKDGVMEVISTDHAPHTADDKNTSMKNAPFGIVGLETAACLTYTELVLGGWLTPMQMAEKMSYNPARIAHISAGDIQPGKPADIVIFDPRQQWTVDKNAFASKGHNTPFHGRKVTGRVKWTICGGRVVYEDR